MLMLLLTWLSSDSPSGDLEFFRLAPTTPATPKTPGALGFALTLGFGVGLLGIAFGFGFPGIALCFGLSLILSKNPPKRQNHHHQVRPPQQPCHRWRHHLTCRCSCSCRPAGGFCVPTSLPSHGLCSWVSPSPRVFNVASAKVHGGNVEV